MTTGATKKYFNVKSILKWGWRKWLSCGVGLMIVFFIIYGYNVREKLPNRIKIATGGGS